MGTPSDPTEPDYEDGDTCVLCEDEIFDGHTPKYVRAKCEGLDFCPGFPPIELVYTFYLRQKAINPCIWYVGYVKGGILWECSFYLATLTPPLKSSLGFYRNGSPYFYSDNEAECLIFFNNISDCGPFYICENGTGAIAWGPDINEDAYDAQMV